MNILQASPLCIRAPVGCLSKEYLAYLTRRGQILALAERILGTRRLAEKWLNQAAPSLCGEMPCGLLGTQAGASIVKDLLIRIEYGVYT